MGKRSVTSLIACALTLIAAAALAFTRVNPVWILAGAALVGVTGLA